MQHDKLHIPPEAVEAAARAACAGNKWDQPCATACVDCRGDATAAIRAALAAWPGAHTHEWQRPWLGGMSGTDIILPLNTEPRDD